MTTHLLVRFSILILAASGICSPFTANAASPMAFRHLGIEQGLSQSSVLSITQDKLGNLWFGTQDGLNVFDGYDFKVYKTDVSNPTSLPSSFVGALFTDSQGRIWAGTASGLSRFDARDRFFENFDGITHGAVNHISAFNSSLALSTDGGLVLFHPDDGSSEPIHLGTESIVRSTFPWERSLLIASDAGLFLLREGRVSPVSGFSNVDVHAVALNEALLQLNPVRILGFPDAEIVAYLDGKPLAVSIARRSE